MSVLPTVMHPWLAERTAQFDASGIRKVFDLAAKAGFDGIEVLVSRPPSASGPETPEAAIADAFRTAKVRLLERTAKRRGTRKARNAPR